MSRSSLRNETRQAIRNIKITSNCTCNPSLSETANIIVAIPDSTKLNIMKPAFDSFGDFVT